MVTRNSKKKKRVVRPIVKQALPIFGLHTFWFFHILLISSTVLRMYAFHLVYFVSIKQLIFFGPFAFKWNKFTTLSVFIFYMGFWKNAMWILNFGVFVWSFDALDILTMTGIRCGCCLISVLWINLSIETIQQNSKKISIETLFPYSDWDRFISPKNLPIVKQF